MPRLTLDEHGAAAVERADAIGCGWSTQGGGMPPVEEITRQITACAAEAHASGGEARRRALREVAARALFALTLTEAPCPG